MVPIGLLTQNRAYYLDVTLRSLSATELPARVPIHLFDDGSDNLTTLDYYSQTKRVAPPPSWPTTKAWQDAGLYTINLLNQPLFGIRDNVEIHRNPAGKSTGVINASCWAINELFRMYPSAPGVLLLQDDVLFTEDWYDRMVQTAKTIDSQRGAELGILCGIKINQKWPDTAGKAYLESGITAQCLYVSAAAHAECRKYFTEHHLSRMRFDDTLRNTVIRTGMWVGSILPFVGQHFGIQSLVRPHRLWNAQPYGRIAHYVTDPLVLASHVKRFKAIV